MISLSFERPEFLLLLLLVLPIFGLAIWSKRKASLFRRLFAAGVRSFLLLLLLLAMAGLTRNKPVDALAVMFVVDQSASIDIAGQRQALEFMRDSLKHREDDDLVGVVVFGADALVEMEPREEVDLQGLESAPSPHQTDIAAGVRLASALLPADRARRIIVLTDGEETRGDVGTQALLTAGDDLEIAVLPLTTTGGADALLEDILAPARVDEGAAYDVRVVARSTTPTTGKLRMYRNDEYMGEVPVELGGERADVFTFRQEAEESGLYRYRATLTVDDPAADRVPQNNQVISTVQVNGRSRVLYVEGYIDQATHLSTALRGEGLNVDVIPPEELPAGLSGLRPYEAVIFSDVPAYMLTRRQQEAMQSYVRDLGRGFIMVGGDQSFGLGGYYETPIEETLPLNMDIKDKTRFPKMAMAMAIDKSCSMSGAPMEMAKEAGVLTAELLSERDMLGVIGFDHSAAWIVPLTEMTERQSVIDTIGTLRVGGGTDIYPALDRSIRGLNATDAALKHSIILSDGMTSPADYQTLIEAAAASGVTISAVAIGGYADRVTMENFARWGGGSYYLVTDPNAIPAIFTRETMLASRSFLIEEPVRPLFRSPSDLLRGISTKDLPVFQGYVGTEAKRRATVALTVPDDEHEAPLLAHWRYGLGRSVAFTSDVKPRWSGRWVATPEYTRFWTQIVRWAVGTGDDANLDMVSEIRDGELIITVDAFDVNGNFRNFLSGEARIVAPDLSVRPVELRQIAPGRYQAITTVDQDGSWLVGVQLESGDDVVGQAVAEAVQPYSPEYRPRGAGRALAQELGRLGGGGVLTDPASVFARPPSPRMVPHPLWPWLLLLLPFVFLFDVAVRRLGLTPRGPVSTVARAVTQGAKGQRRFRTVKPVKKTTRTTAGVPEVVEPEFEEASFPEPEIVDPTSYAGRLLAARKKARDKMDDK
ncbi:MAG: putative membrane protein [Myxococcota bacterium]|jgi:uncharacterized membrane protein